MSVQATGAVWSYSEQPPALRCLLVAIADRINRDYDNAYVKRAYLAGDVGIDSRTVTRWLARLVAVGELVIVMDPGDTHGARYYIPIYEREPGYDPQPCDNPTHRCTGYHTPLEVSRHPRRDEAPRPPRPPRPARPAESLTNRGGLDTSVQGGLDTSVQGGLDTSVQGGLDNMCPGTLDNMCPGSTILAPSTPSRETPSAGARPREDITPQSANLSAELALWRSVWRHLTNEIDDAQRHWLDHGTLYGDGGFYVLTFPSGSQREIVTTRYGERILALIRRYDPAAQVLRIAEPAALSA